MRRGAATVAACLLAAVLSGCTPSSPQPDRPDAAAVVAEYLTALADGDSAAAMRLDAAGRAEAPFTQGDGTGFLETDALADAAERITVESATVEHQGGATASVIAAFSLAGEHFAPKLRLTWDDDSGAWILIDSLANFVEVRALTDQVPGPAPFTLAGALPSGGFDGIDPPVSLAYPGVYRLLVQLSPDTLADPSAELDYDLVVRPLYQQKHVSELAPNIDFVLR